MKYTKEERIDIGRKVYTHELSKAEAMSKYDVGGSCIDNYVNAYKRASGIPVNKKRASVPRSSKASLDQNTEDYMAMSKEELVNELILAKVKEARAKKGYEAKGVGANKEFVSLSDKSSRS